MLLLPDGSEFCIGSTTCFSKPFSPRERLNKLLIQVTIGDLDVEAAIDTGGAYLILDPGIARLINLDSADLVGTEEIHVRGTITQGILYRIPLQIPSEEGMGTSIEVTAFVPTLLPNESWGLPTVLGWHCCLERIRFAVDPLNERFYFGSADN